MAVSGHEEWFPPANLSAGYRFRKQTIAGTRGNDEDAPIPAVRANTIDRLKSTRSGPTRAVAWAAADVLY
jgi:hypothetical protein